MTGSARFDSQHGQGISSPFQSIQTSSKSQKCN